MTHLHVRGGVRTPHGGGARASCVVQTRNRTRIDRRALTIERQRVLARYDVDGDGEMSPDEFILMMSHRQHDPQNEMREVRCRDVCC